MYLTLNSLVVMNQSRVCQESKAPLEKGRNKINRGIESKQGSETREDKSGKQIHAL